MNNIIFCILLAASLNACTEKSSPDGTTGTALSLENTHWKLIALSSLASGIPSLPKDAFLELKDGKLSGFSGCNNYFGSFIVSGNTIHFAGVAMTKMYCKEAMEVENGLAQSLNNADQFRINANHLELLKNEELLSRFEGIAIP